jgi:hypothetical protein
MAAKKKRFKVVGSQPVEGHGPGETFEAALDTEAFLVDIGALKVVKDLSEDKKKD